jgi:hypothetical protein
MPAAAPKPSPLEQLVQRVAPGDTGAAAGDSAAPQPAAKARRLVVRRLTQSSAPEQPQQQQQQQDEDLEDSDEEPPAKRQQVQQQEAGDEAAEAAGAKPSWVEARERAKAVLAAKAAGQRVGAVLHLCCTWAPGQQRSTAVVVTQRASLQQAARCRSMCLLWLTSTGSRHCQACRSTAFMCLRAVTALRNDGLIRYAHLARH